MKAFRVSQLAIVNQPKSEVMVQPVQVDTICMYLSRVSTLGWEMKKELNQNGMNRRGAPRISTAICGRVVALRRRRRRRSRRRRHLRGRPEPFESEREEQTEPDAERR